MILNLGVYKHSITSQSQSIVSGVSPTTDVNHTFNYLQKFISKEELFSIHYEITFLSTWKLIMSQQGDCKTDNIIGCS